MCGETRGVCSSFEMEEDHSRTRDYLQMIGRVDEDAISNPNATRWIDRYVLGFVWRGVIIQRQENHNVIIVKVTNYERIDLWSSMSIVFHWTKHRFVRFCGISWITFRSIFWGWYSLRFVQSKFFNFAREVGIICLGKNGSNIVRKPSLVKRWGCKHIGENLKIVETSPVKSVAHLRRVA